MTTNPFILLGIFIVFFFYGKYGRQFVYKLNDSKEFPFYLQVLAFVFWLPIVFLLVLCFWRPISWIIMKFSGWKLNSEISIKDLPKKSILIMAPHTSWLDAFYGKIAMSAYGIPHTILSAVHLFELQPLKYIMEEGLNAIPIGGVPGKNAIWEVTEYLKEHDTNIIICPEGHLRKVEIWDPGFWAMAVRANVPILVTTMDYKRKELKFLGTLDPKIGRVEIWNSLRKYYSNVHPKYPQKFSEPINKK